MTLEERALAITGWAKVPGPDTLGAAIMNTILGQFDGLIEECAQDVEDFFAKNPNADGPNIGRHIGDRIRARLSAGGGLPDLARIKPWRSRMKGLEMDDKKNAIKKRKLTPRAGPKYTPVMAYELKGMRKAFVTDEPVMSIAHRFGVDRATVYYHCADLREQAPPRRPGRPVSRREEARA